MWIANYRACMTMWHNQRGCDCGGECLRLSTAVAAYDEWRATGPESLSGDLRGERRADVNKSGSDPSGRDRAVSDGLRGKGEGEA